MTLAKALGGLPIIGGDLPFVNTSGVTLPAGTAVLADTSNPPEGDSTGGVTLPTNGGGTAGTLGITTIAAVDGAPVNVRILGAYPAIAYGTIAFGDSVRLADVTAHFGQVMTNTGGYTQLGIALSSADDGEEVLVWIQLAIDTDT